MLGTQGYLHGEPGQAFRKKTLFNWWVFRALHQTRWSMFLSYIVHIYRKPLDKNRKTNNIHSTSIESLQFLWVHASPRSFVWAAQNDPAVHQIWLDAYTMFGGWPDGGWQCYQLTLSVWVLGRWWWFPKTTDWLEAFQAMGKNQWLAATWLI